MDIKSRNIKKNETTNMSFKNMSSEKYGGCLGKEYDKLFEQDICCFDFRSYFLVLISILLNIERKND